MPPKSIDCSIHPSCSVSAGEGGPCRSWQSQENVTSGLRGFAGGQTPDNDSPPAIIRSPELVADTHAVLRLALPCRSLRPVPAARTKKTALRQHKSFGRAAFHSIGSVHFHNPTFRRFDVAELDAGQFFIQFARHRADFRFRIEDMEIVPMLDATDW